MSLRSRSIARPLAAVAAAAALALAAVSPAQAAAPTAVKTCVGTAKQSTLTLSGAMRHVARSTVEFSSGGAPRVTTIFDDSKGTVKPKVTVTYCKSTGSSTWSLWSWSTTPVYGSATVTIQNDKIKNASGPLTLVNAVGTTTSSGSTYNYVQVGGFVCVDAKLTAAMHAQELAKFVTGLPIPGNQWSSVGLWAVSSVIPPVTTPRECATTGYDRLLFSPSSSGVATWTSSSKSNGQAGSVQVEGGLVQVTNTGSGTRTEHYHEWYTWQYKGV